MTNVQEKLIRLVRECAYLYDECERNYSDSAKKEVQWKRIGKQLNLSASDCKKQWNNIRDSFRRAIKKRKLKEGGQPSAKAKKWKYEDEMSFLLPHLKQRENNLEVSHESDEDIEIPDSPIAAVENNSQSPLMQVEERPETPKEMPKTPKPKHFAKLVHSFPPYHQLNTSASTVSMMHHILESKSQEKSQDAETLDDVDHIFLGLAATVKRFSPYMRAIAKARLISIVSELEIEELKQKRSDSRPSFTAHRASPFEHTSRLHAMSSELSCSFVPAMHSRTEQKCGDAMRYYQQLPIEVEYGGDDEDNDVDDQKQVLPPS